MKQLLALLALSACSVTPTPARAPSAPVRAASTTGAASLQPALAPEEADPPCDATPRAVGRILDERLTEVSGVAESHRNPGVLYVHNDSGDSPRFFAINRSGALLAELRLPQVPVLIDAEDLVVGRGPGGDSFIYLGDTGNNFASFGLGIPRRKAVIYRIPEPTLPLGSRNAELDLSGAFPIVFTFPDGARDIEAFFIDPVDGALYLLSKHPNGRSQLLTASADVLAAGGGRLVAAAELRFGTPKLPGSTMPTAAAISRSGDLILVRTYTSVVAFKRGAGQSIASALAGPRAELASVPEAQGEAIGLIDQDRAFLTISEGSQPVVNCTALASPTPQ